MIILNPMKSNYNSNYAWADMEFHFDFFIIININDCFKQKIEIYNRKINRNRNSFFLIIVWSGERQREVKQLLRTEQPSRSLREPYFSSQHFSLDYIINKRSKSKSKEIAFNRNRNSFLIEIVTVFFRNYLIRRTVACGEIASPD